MKARSVFPASPVVKNLNGKQLTSIRLKAGMDFKRHGPKPTLDAAPSKNSKRVSVPNVILNSFIISNTPFRQVRWWTDDLSKDQFTHCHVLFQPEDRQTYIERI